MAGLMFFLKGLITWMLAGAVSRLLVGAGISFVTYQALDTVVTGFLDAVANALAGAPASALTVMRMMGAGDALSIVGSALATVAAIRAAGMVLGMKIGG